MNIDESNPPRMIYAWVESSEQVIYTCITVQKAISLPKNNM